MISSCPSPSISIVAISPICPDKIGSTFHCPPRFSGALTRKIPWSLPKYPTSFPFSFVCQNPWLRYSPSHNTSNSTPVLGSSGNSAT